MPAASPTARPPRVGGLGHDAFQADHAAGTDGTLKGSIWQSCHSIWHSPGFPDRYVAGETPSDLLREAFTFGFHLR